MFNSFNWLLLPQIVVKEPAFAFVIAKLNFYHVHNMWVNMYFKLCHPKKNCMELAEAYGVAIKILLRGWRDERWDFIHQFPEGLFGA